MAIRIEHTPIEAVMKLQKLADDARRENIALQRQEQALAQVREIEARKEMAQFNAQMTVDRMKMEAMLDFEAEQRAKAWDIEKMELRSRQDFEREERKRQRALDEYDAAAKYIKQQDFDEDTENKFLFMLKMNTMNAGVPAREIWSELFDKQDTLRTKRGQLEAVVGPEVGKLMSFPELEQEVRNLGIDPDTMTQIIPQLDEEERVQVISPEGIPGSILKSEIPEYVNPERGFSLVDELPEGAVGEGFNPEEAKAIGRMRIQKFKYPNAATLFSMSPIRFLHEQMKAKNLLKGK